jgi:transglutaminase-like putative cysteine protease
MASLGEHKPHKKSRLFSLPVILSLAIVVIAIVAVGIYIYKPGLVSGLNIPFLATPTPEPTVTPTPEPTATPPTPTPEVQQHDLYNSLLAIGPAIDANNTSVIWFTTNHTNEAGGSYGKLAKACDLFNYVNGHWILTASDGPQYAGDSVSTLKGDDRDYSILMVSLTQALGLDSRVIAAFDGNAVRYYPEIKVASNESDYTDATNYLRGRYNITDPSDHIKGNAHWLSLAMGTNPGIMVNATDEYFVDWKMGIEKL